MTTKNLAVEGREVCFCHDKKRTSKALNDLNISVPKGLMYGLLGPSGCGKTTLLRCITGCLKPTSGIIHVYGHTPGESGFCIPGRGVGYMPQELALYLDITIEETLTYFGRLFHMDYPQIEERILFLLNLLDIPDKSSLIKNLSGGQQRRVSFAAALIHKPPLLILDEPTVGVDPLLRQSLWSHLQNLAATDHTTIIITTHYVEEARSAHMIQGKCQCPASATPITVTRWFDEKGSFIGRKNPEKLIEQYEAHTLEEVFLKLCQSDFKIDANMLSMEPLVSTLEKVVGECDGDTWVSQEGFNKQQKGSPNREECIELLENVNAADAVVVSSKYRCEGESEMQMMYRKSTSFERFLEGYHRLMTLIIKNFIRLKRNWMLVIIQLLIPSFQVILFCLFIGQTPNDLQLAIVNFEAESEGFSNYFLKQIDKKIIIQKSYPTFSSAIESVKTRKTWGVLRIEESFSSAILERFGAGNDVENETIEESTIKLYLDMTNQQIYATIYATINKGFQDFAVSMLKDTHRNPRLADPPVVIADPVYGEKDTNFTEFMAAGIMLSVVNFTSMGLTALSIVLEKKEGLLDRSKVAGVNCAEVVFAIICSMFFTLVLQIIFVLVIVLAVFALPVRGSIFWTFFCLLLAGLGGMVTGLCISSVSSNENQAVMLVLGFFAPTFMLCGIIWPVEAMDYSLRQFSYCLPLTLISDSVRSILSRGLSLMDNYLWIGPLVTSAWIAGLILFAAAVFRYRNYS